FGMSFACLGQSVFHVTGRCRPDRSVDRDGQRKLAVGLPRRGGKRGDNQSYGCSGRNKSRLYGLHSKDSLIEMIWGVLLEPQYARDRRFAAFRGASGSRDDDPERRVEAWGPLPGLTVNAPGLKPGDFTRG